VAEGSESPLTVASTSTAQHRIEFAFGLVLFAVNAIFALLLYLEIASGVWYYQVIYATLSIVFDAAMMLLWIRGRQTHNRAFIAFALAFAAISLFASSSSALTIVERKIHVIEADVSLVESLRASLASTDADIETNRQAIEKTPADFSTRLRELNALGRELRARRDTQVLELQTAEAASSRSRSTATSMFALVAKALHTSESAVMLPFLLGTSLMLIVGSFALTAPVANASSAPNVVTYGTRIHLVRNGKTLCGAPAMPAQASAVGCAICLQRSKETLVWKS
jgi:hypothetical protein